MNKRDLLVNVNLYELTMCGDGPGVSLTFLSLVDGHQVARVLCHGLLAIHCVCDELPAICDVTLEEYAVADSMSRLEKIGYGLAPHVHDFLPPNTKQIYFIVMEGGGIDIQIACVRVEITGQEEGEAQQYPTTFEGQKESGALEKLNTANPPGRDWSWRSWRSWIRYFIRR